MKRSDGPTSSVRWTRPGTVRKPHRGPDLSTSGTQSKRGVDQHRRSQAFLPRFQFDVLPDVRGNGIANIPARAFEAFGTCKQDRLFDLLRFNLDALDARPEVFRVLQLQAFHVLPYTPKWTDDVILPGGNTGHDALDIVTFQYNALCAG